MHHQHDCLYTEVHECFSSAPSWQQAMSSCPKSVHAYMQNMCIVRAADQEQKEILRHALATERKLRDRSSQLVVPNKSFARVRAVCEQQLQLMRQPLQKPQAHASKPAPTPARVASFDLTLDQSH